MNHNKSSKDCPVSLSDSLYILDIFNINVDLRRIIAQYDDKIYSEFTHDDCIDIAAYCTDDEKRKYLEYSGIISEYDNKVYFVMKHYAHVTLYEVIDKKLAIIHRYKTYIEGDPVAIVSVSMQYPKIYIEREIREWHQYIRTDSTILSIYDDLEVPDNVPGGPSRHRECIESGDPSVRTSSIPKWPIVARCRNDEKKYRVFLRDDDISRDITYTYDEMYDVWSRKYNDMICATNNHIYNYSDWHKILKVYNIKTKKKLSEHPIIFNVGESFVKIIVRDGYIYILTDSFTNIYMNVYDEQTKTKVNHMCVVTIPSTQRIRKSYFVMTNEYVYICYLTHPESFVRENALRKIIILKRNSYFINK